MPAPTNLTALTAIDVGALPASITQDVHFAGTTYTVWYKVTTSFSSYLLSTFAFGDLLAYIPTLKLYTGPASAPVLYLGGINAENVPAQFAPTPGDTYYIEVETNSGTVSPAVLTLTVQEFERQTAPVGTIVVNDDTSGFPVVLISGTDGEILRVTSPFPAGEAADVLDNGINCTHDQFANTLSIYSAQFNLITTIPSIELTSLGGVLRTCQGTQRWWFSYFDGVALKVRSLEDDGTLGTPRTITGVAGVTCIAASNDETVLYYSYGGGAFATRQIRRWDLVNDVALSDLVAALTGYLTFDILVLSDDTIVASYINNDITGDVQVRRYDAAGALLNTYNFGTDQLFPAGTLPRLAYAPDDPDSFWVWTHPSGADAGKSRFENVDTATGAILTTVETREFEIGVFQGDPTATPDQLFGNSFSCPFWITRVAISDAATGTIIVVKQTIPTTDVTAFDFTSGGGLTPGTFSLTHGQQQTFNAVPVGSGYSIVETQLGNYQPAVYVVSNGDDPNNISVEADETVVVTVTNTSIFTPTFEIEELPRRWLRRAPIQSSENRRIFHSFLNVDLEGGVGTSTGQGANPQIMMRFSDDSGHTWSNELWRSMGRIGKWGWRAVWHRLGMARNRVYEVSGSDPVKVAIVDAYVQAEGSTDAPHH